MKSIRTFLIIVILSSITLITFLSALNGYQNSLARAEALFDSELVNKARLLSMSLTLYQNNHRVVNEESVEKTIEISESLADIEYFAFQIWKNQQLIMRSPVSPITPIAQFKPGFQDRNFLKHRWRTYTFYNESLELWIITAQRIDIRYILAENITLETILPVIIMLPVLGIVIWLIISYGLSPLRKLARELSEKRIDDLSPISAEQQPDELIQVVNSTNGLFYRLEASFLREKRFASDAAHELRTPISAIKVHLHNLSQIVSEEDSFKQLNLSVERMGYLVEQILNLNRTSPEQYMARFSDVDLYNLAQDVIAREYSWFEQKQLTIELEGEHGHVDGDVFSLDLLLQNLIGNACKYTPEGGSIIVSIKETQKQVILQVQDSGPGVPEEHYERLFDRFYRLNGDCHDSGTIGCGLGLAIVHQIVELHQAEIILAKSSFQSGLSVSVLFKKN